MKESELLKKYAKLLVHYCLEIKRGDKLYIRTTTLAEPLVKEVYREAINAGAWVESDLMFEGQSRILIEGGSDDQLDTISPFYKTAVEEFDALLSIRAPFSLRNLEGLPKEKKRRRQKAHADLTQTYFKRYGDGSLRTTLCQYPTESFAKEAGISLKEATDFIYKACKLNSADPVSSWLDVKTHQQTIVDYLDQRTTFRYVSNGTDIQFNTKGRRWINSDGKHNMPSGEVYTSPVEESVEGIVHFAYPVIYQGQEIEGVTLWVEKGHIQKWEAKQGKDLLDNLFNIEGARYFGEAAIGTNFEIDRFTKNILFDEKIGGTVHMAVGQSYPAAGGKNRSSIHLDMIADMMQGGHIYADGEKCYENGRFLFLAD